LRSNDLLTQFDKRYDGKKPVAKSRHQLMHYLGSRKALWMVFAGALVLCGIAALALQGRLSVGQSPPALKLAQSRVDVAIPVPRPELNVMKAMSPSQALALNAAVPFFAGAIESALPFVGKRGSLDPLDKKAALDCLAAAVYYEAANQGISGQRAVAQVVLNRVRHPAFPSSVCGVVYQGSERGTGCQFTFTCDGSLRRKPTAAEWSLAQRIATEALDGYVDRSVGMATHYHSDVVVPYWAGDLLKIAAVGDHIFYRWRGYWGERVAFRRPYSGEVAPWGNAAFAPAVESSDIGLPPGVGGDREALAADATAAHLLASPVGAAVEPKSQLRADENRGTLKIDQDEPHDRGIGAGNNVAGETPAKAPTQLQ